MRNTDERVQAALLGAEKIKRKQAHRRIQTLAITASLCLVVLLSLTVPTLVGEGLSGLTTAGLSASIFASSHALRYIMVGLLSFALGVCVTVLCMLLHKKHSQEDTAHEP